MRIAILSDIHANHLALRAALADADHRGAEKYWFLGDLIGYGPSPVEAVQWLMGELDDFLAPEAWVMGNHDAMLADLLLQGETGVSEDLLQDRIFQRHSYLPPNLTLPNDLDALDGDLRAIEFAVQERNRAGQELGRILYHGKCRGEFLSPLDWQALNGVAPLIALELNRRELADDAHIDAFWKDAFTLSRVSPHVIQLDGLDCVLVHSGQVSNLFRYIYSWQHDFLLPAEFRYLHGQAADRALPRVQFFGHTHVPTLVKARPGQRDGEFILEEKYILPGETFSLVSEADTPWLALVNPGSVGQPRDLDPRAAYAILDSKAQTITFHRVRYDHQEIYRLLNLNYYPGKLRNQILSAEPTSGTPEDWRRHYLRAREVIA